MKKPWLAGVGLIGLCVIGMLIFHPYQQAKTEFDGQRAYDLVATQMSFGPRIPDEVGNIPREGAVASIPTAHQRAVHWSVGEFEKYDWQVETRDIVAMDHPITNIYARKGTTGPLILIGAHYDSRLVADQDISQTDQPVPGANDGASGVAVILELARTLDVPAGEQVWLVLFDAEDQGGMDGWDWILGSTLAAGELNIAPRAVVILDMIGDRDLNIYYEKNSDPKLREEIWSTAKRAGFGAVFIPEEKYAMLDDHTPFLQRGYTAVDIIDFDYPYWHTTEDTLDKVSAASLEAVGRTLEIWIEKRGEN